jgi:hypothetical protein
VVLITPIGLRVSAETPHTRLVRPLAVDRYPVQASVGGKVIVDRLMLGTAVVPDRNGVHLPVKATGIFRNRDVLKQIGKQSIALKYRKYKGPIH